MAVQAIKVKEMWWLIGSTPVVPGSNPASLTVENSEDRQSHCVYNKNLGAERETTHCGKKKQEEKYKPTHTLIIE